jgi:alpha-tubulin suppressor-like RCC1 family protein
MLKGRRCALTSAALVLAGVVAGGCAASPGGGSTGSTGDGGGGGVTTATTTVDGHPVTVSVPSAQSVTVEAASSASVPSAPQGLSFPVGALNVDVGGLAPGGLVTLDVTLDAPVAAVRKVVNGVWDPFVFDGTTGAVVSADGRHITVHLQDGGRGDADGTANGTIVDPIAPTNFDSDALAADNAPIAAARYDLPPYSLPGGVRSGPAPLTVAFYSDDSYDPDGTTLFRLWTFGDGTTSTDADPIHTFSSAGTYETSLAVYDDFGLSSVSTTMTTTVTTPFVATQITAGDPTCALGVGGTAKCWGSNNSSGALGTGNTDPQPLPVDVVGLSGATQIVSGFRDVCAVVAGGAVRCWGTNESGQLGDGTTTARTSPVDVVGVSGATQVALGYSSACALVAGGTVKCWGSNTQGQLGDGTTTDSLTPVDVLGVSGATQLVSGSGHACALVAGGAVMCWGANPAGGVGTYPFDNEPTPVDATGLTGVVQLAAGADHTCALMADGTVKCWGGSPGSGIPNANPFYETNVPTDLAGLTGVTRISTDGANDTCALLAGGTAKCWGGFLQLVDGTIAQSVTPLDIVGLSGATEISPAGSCALVAGGVVKCWGYLGIWGLPDVVTSPTAIPL